MDNFRIGWLGLWRFSILRGQQSHGPIVISSKVRIVHCISTVVAWLQVLTNGSSSKNKGINQCSALCAARLAKAGSFQQLHKR